MPAPDLPRTIGRYEVEQRLGHGGMGVVYRCRDPRLGRTVALKLLRLDEEDRRDEELRERFRREARAAGSLEHPNIVTIFDVGEDDGLPFIVMELIEGVTLAQQIRSVPPLTLERKLQVIEDLAAALDYAHKQDIVHRDIKPANLMLTRAGVLKILDFGIARMGGSSHTQLGVMMGSPNYMSPEQAAGQPADARSDIFSVGLVFYELLSNRRAFAADSANAAIIAIMSRTPEPLTELMPGIDPDLAAIVDRAIAKKPIDRYQTAEELSDDVGGLRRRLFKRTGSDESTIVMRPSARGAAHPPTPRGSTHRELLKRRADTIDGHLQTARQACDAHDYAAAIEACEQAQLLDPDEPRALELLEKATVERDRLLIRGWLDEARRCVERLDAERAAQLVARALELAPASPDVKTLQGAIARIRRDEQERQRTAQAALARARASLSEGHLETAIRATSEVLGHYPTHAEAHELTRRALAAIQERREQAERDRAALDVVEQQKLEFAAGRRSDAIAALEQFAPGHAAVSAALADLRRELAAVEQREQEERERQRLEQADSERRQQAQQRWVAQQLEQARQTMEAHQYADAIEALEHVERIDPAAPGLVALLEEARAADSAFRLQQQIADELARIADDVNNGRLSTALVAVESVLARAPDHAIARARRDEVLAAIEARRRQDRLTREAAEAIEAANQRFSAGEHAAAVAMLEAFTPSHPAIVRALDELRSKRIEVERRRRDVERREREIEEAKRAEAARTALERARRSLGRNEFADVLRALDETALLDSGNPEIPALRTRAIAGLEDARRRAEHDRRAGEAIAASRRRCDDGDAAGAVEVLEHFLPRHELVSAALEDLRVELAARERSERDAARRRRTEDLSSACERGFDALNQGDFMSANRLADEALAIEPASADANELKVRAVASLEERSRRADHERRAREAVAAARRLLASGSPADALDLLHRFDPPHPLIAEAVSEVRAGIAAIEDIRQNEQATILTPFGREDLVHPTARPPKPAAPGARIQSRSRGRRRTNWQVAAMVAAGLLLPVSVFVIVRLIDPASPSTLPARLIALREVTVPSLGSRPVSGQSGDASPGPASEAGGGAAPGEIDAGGTGGGSKTGIGTTHGGEAAVVVGRRGDGAGGATGAGVAPGGGGATSDRVPAGNGSGTSVSSAPGSGGAPPGAAGTPGGGGASAGGGGAPSLGGAPAAGGGTSVGGGGAPAAGAGTSAVGVSGGGAAPGGGAVAGGGTPAGGGPPSAGGAAGGNATTAGGASAGGGPNPVGGSGRVSGAGGANAGGGASSTASEATAVVDRREIEQVVEQYRLAYNRKDLNAIRQVYPSATNELTFRSALKGCSSVDLTFTSSRTDVLSDGTAQVETSSIYGCTPGTRQPRVASPPVVDTFRLARRGGSWVIVDLLVPRGR